MSKFYETNLKSILDIDDGSIKERADYELEKVIANINDINTDPKAKRKLTIEITLNADENRKSVFVTHSVKTKLVPISPREMTLFNTYEIDADTGEGIRVLKEFTGDVPAGQINLDGEIKRQEVYVIGQSYRKHLEVKKQRAISGEQEGRFIETETGEQENE